MLFVRAAYAQVDVKPAPNVDDLAQTTKRVMAAHCNRSACRAVILIDRAVDSQIAGAAATVGRPRPIPRDRDVRAAVTYKQLAEQGRSLLPELCRQAAALMSGYSAPGVASEIVVPVAVLNLTARLDGEATVPNCTRMVIRAMPTSPAADIAIRNARGLCVAQGGAARCATIFR